MRQGKSRRRLSTGFLIGMSALALLGARAWAYVNGGDRHSDQGRYPAKLLAAGWVVTCGEPAREHWDVTKEIAPGVSVGRPDSPEYHRLVNELVGRAVKALPQEEAEKIPVEVKREIARVAREAIRADLLVIPGVNHQGKSGSLRYQVGAYRYSSYWETNYGGQRRVHAQFTGLVPYVALMTTGHTPAPASPLEQAEARAARAGDDAPAGGDRPASPPAPAVDRADGAGGAPFMPSADGPPAWAESRITVVVPADAEVFFDGRPTRRTGTVRQYVTPPLEVATLYRYEVLARWQEDGKTAKRRRKVSVIGGDRVRVNFLAEEEKFITFEHKRVPPGGRDPLEGHAYSPDRRTVAVAFNGPFGSRPRTSVRLYDAATDKPLGPVIELDFGGLGRATAVAVAPDGKTVATATTNLSHDDGEVRVWGATTGRLIEQYAGGDLGEVYRLSFNAEGNCVTITGGEQGGK